MNPKYKKLVLAVVVPLVVGLGGYGAYSATSALFTDTEKNTTNTFTAGTLDMSVDGNNGTAFDNFTIQNIGVDGTVSGGKEWVITNNGSVPGHLSFKLNNVTNLENGCNEAEKVTEPGCEADNNGELGDAVSVVVSLDRQNDGTYDVDAVTSDLAVANASQYATQWNANVAPVTIDAGQSVKVRMNWSTDPTAYDNRIQSDSLSFGIQFDLEQVTPQVTATP